MRTTLTLDDDVFAKLQAEARRSGKPFKEAVNDALRVGLNVRRRHPQTPFQVKPRALGLRDGLQYESVEALLDEVDGPAHR